jgi:hypothetical protein
MLRGEIIPSMPKVPPEVHIRAGEEVPYTPTEMRARTAAYDAKIKIWNQTMKVSIVIWHYCYTICVTIISYIQMWQR